MPSGVVDHAQAGVIAGGRVQPGPRAVGGHAVGHDHLVTAGRVGLGEHGGEAALEEAALVAHRHHDRHERPRGVVGGVVHAGLAGRHGVTTGCWRARPSRRSAAGSRRTTAGRRGALPADRHWPGRAARAARAVPPGTRQRQGTGRARSASGWKFGQERAQLLHRLHRPAGERHLLERVDGRGEALSLAGLTPAHAHDVRHRRGFRRFRRGR